MSKDFRRQDLTRYLKLGKKIKTKKWRKPKGRHSKMRLKRKSYPASVSIGRKKQKTLSGKIKDLVPVIIHNVNELSKLNTNSIAIIGKIGAKKKLEILKIAQEKNIPILNVRGKNEIRR